MVRASPQVSTPYTGCGSDTSVHSAGRARDGAPGATRGALVGWEDPPSRGPAKVYRVGPAQSYRASRAASSGSVRLPVAAWAPASMMAWKVRHPRGFAPTQAAKVSGKAEVKPGRLPGASSVLSASASAVTSAQAPRQRQRQRQRARVLMVTTLYRPRRAKL